MRRIVFGVLKRRNKSTSLVVMSSIEKMTVEEVGEWLSDKGFPEEVRQTFESKLK